MLIIVCCRCVPSIVFFLFIGNRRRYESNVSSASEASTVRSPLSEQSGTEGSMVGLRLNEPSLTEMVASSIAEIIHTEQVNDKLLNVMALLFWNCC